MLSTCRLAVLTALAIGGMTALAPGPAQAQGLVEALALTYDSNPRLGSARASLRATDELLPQARSNMWRPSVSLNANEGRTYIDESDGGSRGESSFTDNQTDRSLGYEIDLPLFRGGQTVAEINEARATIDGAEANLIDTEQEVLQDAISAYADVVYYRALYEIDRENVEDLQRIEQALVEMVAAQRRTVTDLAQLRDNLAQARARLSDLIGQLGGADSNFKATVGRLPGVLERWPSLTGLPASFDEALQLGEQLNPAVVAAHSQIRADEAAVRAAIGVLMPQVNLYHDYTWEKEKSRYSGLGSNNYDEIDDSQSWSIGVEVKMQLYQGGYNHSAVREAKQTLSQSRLDLATARREMEDDVTSAWDRLEAARDSVEINRERLAAASQAEEGLTFQVRRGTATMREFLDVRENRLLAQAAIEASQQEVLLASAALLVAIGRLTAESLELPVELYDPKAYLREVEGKFFGLGD